MRKGRQPYHCSKASCAQTAAAPEDTVRLQLLAVKKDGKVDKPEELKQRKLIATRRDLYYSIGKGEKYARTIARLETDLTAEMLQR